MFQIIIASFLAVAVMAATRPFLNAIRLKKGFNRTGGPVMLGLITNRVGRLPQGRSDIGFARGCTVTDYSPTTDFIVGH